ncbi:MAG: TonB-dependent receptor [Alphaproteobacteria bacterium]
MLYGAGAIAGLYHIVSHAPELNQRSAAVRASGEGGDSGEVGSDIELMYNQPLAADRAGLRLVAYREETPGWLNNAGVNQSNTNTTVRQGARATALIRFGGTWSLTMRALTQRIDSGDSQYAEAGLRLVRRTSILESNHTDFSLLNATVRGSIKTGEFTSTTSFSRHLLSGLSEAYGTVGTVAISPTSTAVYDDGRTNQAFDQEFRFTALASPTPWSIGMFISNRQRERTGSLFTNVLVRSAQYTLDRSDDAVEFAGYGDISFPFSEKWTLAIAGRASGTRLSTTGAAQAFPGSRSDDFSGKRTEWGVAPKASLSYEPRTGSLYYLTIANGYRTGGFNVGDAALLTAPTRDQPNREYAGDNVWTLEAGAKRSFFNQRVDMRAGAFWQDWINIQTDQLQVAGLPFTGNVGDGVSRGVELEANYRVSSDLSAHGFVRYTDSEVTNPNATFPVRANSRLPGVPNFMASASAQYDRPISANTHFLLSTQVLYVGRATQGFSAQNVTPIGGYTEVNLRTGLVGEKWSLTAFVNNAADAATATFAYGNPFLFGQSGTVTPLRPRSYGLELGRDF